ncbi:uncharacterized protein LOC135218730 [Macrobrachium nipponense]|uniref:uncharacterized protein LOC135218730 n=1 Tax=Macrobrachium nipponense TaxID=159736 RepID=UPI0030C82833
MSSSTYRSRSWMRYSDDSDTEEVDIEHILLPQAPHRPSEKAQDVGTANVAGKKPPPAKGAAGGVKKKPKASDGTKTKKPPPKASQEEEEALNNDTLPGVEGTDWNAGNFLGGKSQVNSSGYFYGLHHLINLNMVTVRRTTSETYTVKDPLGTVLYYASTPIEYETSCCGYGSAFVTGTNFTVTTASYQQVLSMKKVERNFCFLPVHSAWKIKLTHTAILGLMEDSHRYTNYHLLKWMPGRTLCIVRRTYFNQSTGDRHYKVIPSMYPSDYGSIMFTKSKGIIVHFPKGFDIPGRALLLSGAIILQYQIEGERRHTVAAGRAYYRPPPVVRPGFFAWGGFPRGMGMVAYPAVANGYPPAVGGAYGGGGGVGGGIFAGGGGGYYGGGVW